MKGMSAVSNSVCRNCMRWQNPEKQEYGYYNINLLVSHLTQILPIRGKQRAPDEKAAYPCWASVVPIFVQVCLSTVFYGGYVFIFENINQKNYPSHLHETCRWLFLLYIIMSPPSIFKIPESAIWTKSDKG